MKVVYLTWGETPRSYGVFGSQVIGQFVQTAKLSPRDQFYFISGIPIIHSGLLREKWRYFSEVKRVKNKLASVAFHWLPILTSQNFVNSSKLTFNLMHGISHLILKRKLAKLKPDIVHCRSYHAAWAALKVRKKYKLSFKIIFDGRGLWPEEVALKRSWLDSSVDYQFLKSIEKMLLTECDVSISVSNTMHEHYIGIGAKNDQCIYLSADTEQLKLNLANLSQSNTVRFCYVGALSDDTWHQPSTLVSLYRELRKLFDSTQLTIVTTSSHEVLAEQFSEFPQNEIIFTSTKTKLELKKVLEHQDIGLMAYFVPETDNEKLLGEMVLAVKTAEYLMAGLPMLCNAYCGGAARIIKDNDLGITYYPKELNGLTTGKITPYLTTEARDKCQAFALRNFDYTVNAKKYNKIYKSVLGKCLN